jgi:hypothetical protein
MTEDTGQKLGIDWLKTIAGALAAVSSAVLLSTLGAAGTIIGAALGSVVVTVGGALYGQGLASSRARLAQAPITVRRRPGTARAEGTSTSRDQGGDPTAAAPGDEPHGPGRWERFAMLPWKRISLGAAGLFAVTVLAITAFEIAAGSTVSSMTGGSSGGGGTTITRLGGGSDGGTSPDDGQAPSDGTTSPSSEPTDQASPTDLASPTAEPTDQATESPSGSTSPAPTPATPTTLTPTLPAEPTTTP